MRQPLPQTQSGLTAGGLSLSLQTEKEGIMLLKLLFSNKEGKEGDRFCKRLEDHRVGDLPFSAVVFLFSCPVV